MGTWRAFEAMFAFADRHGVLLSVDSHTDARRSPKMRDTWYHKGAITTSWMLQIPHIPCQTDEFAKCGNFDATPHLMKLMSHIWGLRVSKLTCGLWSLGLALRHLGVAAPLGFHDHHTLLCPFGLVSKTVTSWFGPLSCSARLPCFFVASWFGVKDSQVLVWPLDVVLCPRNHSSGVGSWSHGLPQFGTPRYATFTCGEEIPLFGWAP